MSQLAIDQLPELCLKKIFGYFGPKDLAKCKAVNRRFKLYADQLGIPELIVRVYNPKEEYPCRWYLTDRRIEWKHSINRQEFKSIQTLQPQLRQQLKFLFIDSFEVTDLEFINGCKHLEHLEAREPNRGSSLPERALPNHSPSEWTLPNLKVLCFHSWNYHRMVLKTPSLQVLHCRRLKKVEIKYPETIKKLECEYLDNKKIAHFKNLEVFRCEAYAGVLDRVVPGKSKNLKELRLRINFENAEFQESYELFRKSLDTFLSRMAKSKGGEKLKIFFNDVRLINADQLEDFTFMSHPWNFYLKNFKHITAGRRFGMTRINYSDLMTLLVTELSSDFFEKFPSIRTVEVTDSTDLDQLIWFLKNTRILRELVLSSSLGDLQRLLDNLPNNNDRLTYLKITENHANAVTDFSFIQQLTSLFTFATDLQVEGALDLAEKLFKQIASFQEFKSKTPWNEEMVIRRDHPPEDHFEISFSEDKTRKINLLATKKSWTDLVELWENRKVSYGQPNGSS